MTDLIFSPDISDEMRDRTQALFDWVSDSNNMRQPLPEAFKQAIETGTVDIHAKQSNDWTLLHYLAKHNLSELCESLFQQGFSAQETNVSSYTLTPLHLAALLDATETCEVLLNHGVNVNAQDTFGSTPLHTATSRNNPELCKLLIQHGADIERRDNTTRPPLHTGLLGNHKDACITLLQHGANINTHALSDTPATTQDTVLNYCNRNRVWDTWDGWKDGSLKPEQLDLGKTMHLLSAWPLANPRADVPRFEHLEAIFSDARWKDEHAEHKLDLIQQIPGLSSREQMFLMGGHARTLMQKRNEATQTQGAER